MIDKQTIIDKLGKQKAIEFIQNSRSNQPTAFDKTRGIRGRIKWRRCQHGVWVINNYEPQRCEDCCEIPVQSKTPDFKPYFNIGLGAFVESRSEEKRIARQKHYVEAG